ncbi:MAG: glutamate-5-semialdehyde dehydrogenase [Deltaproteobacteria bacterium]|jgi:glutamate-5-semialdehyde dehydrogenase|nr:glutamate-5-semialdehyde dehydrogenase [Deltaproteobacteria bacterium]
MTLRPLILKAREAKVKLSASSGETRNTVLLSLASEIEAGESLLLEANVKDQIKAQKEGLGPALIDRLTLTSQRIKALAKGIRETAFLPDPLGAIEDYRTLPSGLTVGRARVPLGLILFICEARPGAVAEAASMALKSGNCIVIKPGKEAKESSKVLGDFILKSLGGLPSESATILWDTPREGILELLQQHDLIDLVIPRGGEGLIRYVSENSRIPVLKHFKGVCHLYVDETADLKMAVDITLNAKANRPGTCNALECLLVHETIANEFFEALIPQLLKHKIQVRAHQNVMSFFQGMEDWVRLAEPSDFGQEFLDLILALKVVGSIDEALSHIQQYGSNHTESIVTNDRSSANRFLKEVDAGCVMVNASTRLNDGGCLGLGAEIGISTSKLQAYGPMGLLELTTRKFVVLGEGHLRD